MSQKKNNFLNLFGRKVILTGLVMSHSLFAGAADSTPVTQATVDAYYKSLNPVGFETGSISVAAQQVVADHIKVFGEAGIIYSFSNMGNSDTGYSSPEKLNQMVRAEVEAVAKEMAAKGGGTLLFEGGGTNSGIGQTVISIQDKVFQGEIFAKYKVVIKTVGLGTSQGIMNHPGYGNTFFNLNLDYAVQVLDSDWVHRIRGMSVVHLLGPTIAKIVDAKKILVEGRTTIRGGGKISLQEGTQRILLQNQLAQELGISQAEVNRRFKIFIQEGLLAGEKPSQYLAGKGPNVVVDLIFNLNILASIDSEFAKMIDASGLTLERFNSEYNRTSSRPLDTSLLAARARSIMNAEQGLLRAAADYATKLSAIEAGKLTPEESAKRIASLQSEIGILQKAEINALKAEYAALDALGKDVKSEKDQIRQNEIDQRLKQHQNVIRITGVVEAAQLIVEEVKGVATEWAQSKSTDMRALSSRLSQVVESARVAGVVNVAEGRITRGSRIVDSILGRVVKR